MRNRSYAGFAPDAAELWIYRLNWGALVFTGLWLLRNGFLLTLLCYIGLLILFPIAAWLVSIALLLCGNRWSWGEGNRWSSLEEFADEQCFWNLIGIAALGGGPLLLALERMFG